MSLPPPATGAEQYLAAVLGELRALRVAVEGGSGEPTPTADGAVRLTEPAQLGTGQLAEPAPSSTKRTRTRPRG